MVDVGVDEAGVVVDDGADVGLAHQRIAVLIPGLVVRGGSVLLSLPASYVAPAPPPSEMLGLLRG